MGGDHWKPQKTAPDLRSSHPSQESAENDSDRLQEAKIADFSPILGPKKEQTAALIEASFLGNAASIRAA